MDGWIKLSENDRQVARYVNRRNIVSVNDMGGGVVATMWNGDTVGMPELPPDEPKLPYDAEVEYLESDGTQWIDTGIDVSESNTFSLRMTGFSVRPSGGESIYFSFYRAGGYGINIATSRNQPYVYTNAQYNFPPSWGEFDLELWFGGTTMQARMNSTTLNIKSITNWRLSGKTVHMWRYPPPGTIVTQKGFRVYSFSGVVDGAQTFDYQPVRVGQTGYLYDRANPTGGPLGNGLYGDFSDGKGGITGFPANLVGPDKPKP